MKIIRTTKLKLFGTQTKMNKLEEFRLEFVRVANYVFKNYEINADLNASKNILNQFINGKYGSVFKTNLE